MVKLGLAQDKVLVQLPACSCQASHLPTLKERAVACLLDRYAPVWLATIIL